jgi:hypothetical protein
MPLSASERSLRATLASHESWANTPDRTARSAPGRRAFNERFLDQVDPDRVLPAAERLRRAESARKAHFARMALKSANARRERAEKRKSNATGDA